MKRTTLVAALALFATPAHADPAECAVALQAYNAAVPAVANTLRTYARCVSDSRGHDDCSLEFSTLHSAQDDFETAVQSYGADCS